MLARSNSSKSVLLAKTPHGVSISYTVVIERGVLFLTPLVSISFHHGSDNTSHLTTQRQELVRVSMAYDCHDRTSAVGVVSVVLVALAIYSQDDELRRRVYSSSENDRPSSENDRRVIYL